LNSNKSIDIEILLRKYPILADNNSRSVILKAFEERLKNNEDYKLQSEILRERIKIITDKYYKDK
jgi:hypothetical protein